MKDSSFDKQAFVESMKADERAEAFFQEYDAKDDAIERFLDAYAEHKKRVVEKGNFLSASKNIYKKKPLELAWQAYKEIVNRKIFLAQCLWRARKLDLSDVDISYVFWHWGENPLHCPFIEPVTTDELELMKRFLTREDFSKEDFENGGYGYGQDYERYKNPADEENMDPFDRYPPWYAYCDEHQDEFDWRALPDLRGEKEALYIEAGKEKAPPSSAPVSATDKQPIDYEDEDRMMIELAEDLGDEFTAQYLKDKRLVNSGEMRIDEQMALHYLQTPHGELIPIPADDNWPVAIKRSAEGHQAKIAAAMLEDIHQEYEYQKANDLLEPVSDRTMYVVGIYREEILAGRKKLGEPEDTNY